VLPGWAASFNSRVEALAVNGNTLYVGGYFSGVSGQARSRMAALNAPNGNLLPWNPTAHRDVPAQAVHPATGRLVVGGSRSEINGSTELGTALIDGATGAVLPWEVNDYIQNYGPNTQFSDLATDGNHVFGISWAYFGHGGPVATTANFEGTFAGDPAT